MKIQKILGLLIILAFILGLVACQSGADSKPATDIPAATKPPPTPAATFTPTPTVVPTETPTPTITPSIISRTGMLIQNRGLIRIGIRHDDMFPMFFQDGIKYSGFEVDLATEIVQRLFGDQVVIQWIPLTTNERLQAVQNGTVDFLIRTTTHTTSRENQVLFTSNYFLDGLRLLVRRADGYTGIESLSGKTIVAANEFYASPVRNAAAAAGIDINIFVSSDILTVFNSQQANAVAADWTAHDLYSNNYIAHQAIGNLLSSEPLAIAVSRDDSVFRDEIDRILLEIISDGTWQTIYDDWFSDPSPWTIEEMLSEPPANR